MEYTDFVNSYMLYRSVPSGGSLYTDAQLASHRTQIGVDGINSANNINSSRKDDRVDEMIEQFNLSINAMWHLIREKFELSDEDIFTLIHEIDSSDGKVDGKLQPKPTECECGAKVSPTSHICVYCGADATPTKI